MLVTERYTPHEILQILVSFYHLQEAYDPVVLKGQELNFETTVSDYIDIGDLLPPKQLAKYYHGLFEISAPLTQLEEILVEDKSNTLQTLCEYIAKHANKENIKPITLLGQQCTTAAIFKQLTTNLQKRGVKTVEIRPSSPFIPLFKKYGGVITEEVNKLAPGALSKFEYTNNRIVRIGEALLCIFLFSIILVPLIWHFHWALFITLGLGLIMIFIGRTFKPEKEIIGGYNTIRDLIIGMQLHLEKSSIN